jgi:hypothetical protein
VGRKQRRIGWLLSAPLAILNMQVAMTIVFRHNEISWVETLINILPATLFCAIFGAIIWGPALVLTLVAFGVPIAWSQKQAEKGLAGEERGEVAVGLTVALLSLLALTLGASRYPSAYYRPELFHLDEDRFSEEPGASRGTSEVVKSLHAPDSPATWALAALGVLGAGCGGAAAWLGLSRERRRRRFVASAEAGNENGYTVRETPEGKVLVRVAPDQPTYRAFDEDEDLFALDPAGLATHPSPSASRELPPSSHP